MSAAAKRDPGDGSAATNPLRPVPAARGGWGARSWYLWAPLALLAIYAAPLVVFQLPNYQSVISEEYQPVKTLRFFHSRGTAFAKWGPIDNFLLAPVYAVTLAWWWSTGSFGPPQASFPYGFHEPLQQLSTLILEGRLILWAVGSACLVAMGALLARSGASRWAVCVALVACVATNPVIVSYLVILKPDAPMIAFLSLALGIYTLVVTRGVSPARLFALSTAVVLAVSSKEIAAPVLLLPCIAVGLRAFERGTAGATKVAAIAAAGSGVTLYMLLNVVYAPATWLERMRFWLADSGADGAVWGHPDQSTAGFAMEVLREVVENVGPGGAAIVATGLGALALLNPRLCLHLLLPLVSFGFLGLARVGYVPAYFCIPIALAAVPLTAFGLDALATRCRRRSVRLAAAGALVVAVVTNVVYGNLAWIQLGGNVQYLAERHAVARLRPGSVVSLFSFWPRPATGSRLEDLGFTLDRRGAAEIITGDPGTRPEVLYVDPALKLWLEEIPRMPKRAKMIEENSGFTMTLWPGFEGLGYELTEVVRPHVPGWYPFARLPRERADNRLGLLVYRQRVPPSSPGAVGAHAPDPGGARPPMAHGSGGD